MNKPTPIFKTGHYYLVKYNEHTNVDNTIILITGEKQIYPDLHKNSMVYPIKVIKGKTGWMYIDINNYDKIYYDRVFIDLGPNKQAIKVLYEQLKE